MDPTEGIIVYLALNWAYNLDHAFSFTSFDRADWVISKLDSHSLEAQKRLLRECESLKRIPSNSSHTSGRHKRNRGRALREWGVQDGESLVAGTKNIPSLGGLVVREGAVGENERAVLVNADGSSLLRSSSFELRILNLCFTVFYQRH